MTFLLFATTNENKIEEANSILEKDVKQYEFEYREIRSDNIEEIAVDKAQKAYKKTNRPVFVEDSGLFIPDLEGFPGTYSSWVYDKLGLRVYELAEGQDAYFAACIAYCDGNNTQTFNGKCKGKITKPKGDQGFGYDPIFLPKGYKKTFAQNTKLKNKLSHRKKALYKFKEHVDVN